MDGLLSISEAVGDPRIRRFTCPMCKVDSFRRTGKSPRMLCTNCEPKWVRARSNAVAAVQDAIHRKKLVRPSKLNCADCGKKAYCYEHRDYLLPLDVQPVCRACNHRRGPAKFTVSP